MKTKIVYVTTCNENNIYLEQVLMSAYTARLHNPKATIVLVTDVDSEKTITGKRAEIRKYVDEVIPFVCPDGFNNMKKSRYLKTNLRNLIDGDFIYIDSDTVICGPLDEIDDITDDISGVCNKHLKWVKKNEQSSQMMKKLGWDFEDDFIYINGGVLVVKETELAHDFFREWYSGWLYTSSKGVYMDMPSLHMAELKLGYKIKEISGIWNCQIEGAFLNFLASTKILHYYAMGSRGSTSSYKLRNESLYHRIQQEGKIPEDVIWLLEHPLQSFSDDTLVIAGETLNYLRSTGGLRKLYKYFPKLSRLFFSAMDKLSLCLSFFIGAGMRRKFDK